MLDDSNRAFLSSTSTAGDGMPSLDEVLSVSPTEALEATVRDLVYAARRLLTAVKLDPRPSPRAEEDLRRARDLVDALGAALRDSATAPEALRLAEDGTWFETGGARVDVARRGAVRRILAALGERRAAEPGKALGVDELFGIGWPGERIPYESQVRRVYTAIWTLRTLGLDGMLLTRDEGYLLDPKRSVTVTP